MQLFFSKDSGEDRLVQGLACDDRARVFYIDNTRLVRELLERSDRSAEPLTAALAESFSALCLLTGTLKDTQRLTFKIAPADSRSRIFVDAEADGSVRAYLDQESERDHAPISRHSSGGTIRCIRASGDSQFTGITDMPYASMDLNLEHYFRQSEQIHTLIRTRIEVSQNQCVSSEAVFVQLLPGAPESLMAELRQSLQNEGNLRDQKVVSGMRRLGERPVRLQCYCSREMMAGMAMWPDDAQGELPQGQVTTVICRICGRHYEV